MESIITALTGKYPTYKFSIRIPGKVIQTSITMTPKPTTEVKIEAIK